MKKTYKKLLTLCVSVAAAYGIILACAGGDYDPGDNSAFTPENINKPHLEPFFYTDMTPFYGIMYYDNYLNNCQDLNLNEWEGFLEKKISKSKLNYWLYRAPLKEVGNMLLLVKAKKASVSDSSNYYSLVNAEPKDKISAFLFYLGFAKRNEKFSTAVADEWSDKSGDGSMSEVSIDKQIEGGLKLLANAKTEFIKERYVFQLTRLYYYKHQYKEAVDFYSKNESVFTSGNSMKWRALGYAAAAEVKLKNFAQSNYKYALIFRNFEPLKYSAYLSFHPQSDADWKASLALAKDNKEKITLWTLYGLYTHSPEAMNEIYALDSKAAELDLLMVRAVNMEENKDNGPRIIRKWDKDKSSFSGTPDSKILSTIGKIAGENKTANPALWNLAAAYLNYAQKDFSAGDKYLSKAKSSSETSAMMKIQYTIVSVFGKINRVEKFDAGNEKAILEDLKILMDTKLNAPERTRINFAKTWVKNTVALIYLNNKQPEAAEMVQHGTADFNFTEIKNLDRMLAYYAKSNKSEMEKFWMERSELSLASYDILKGIRYAQRGVLDSAEKIFSKYEFSNDELPANPFNARIRDCHDCDHAAAQKIKYNNTTFVRKMIDMRNKAQSNKAEAAQNYFLMANGFYNITWYGNCRAFFYNSVDETDFNYYTNENDVHRPELDCSIALKYYLLAAENSTDKEFKAKCYYMAAKCELYTGNKDYFIDKNSENLDRYYFHKLSTEYKDAKYTKELLKECSWYRIYITGK